MQSLIEKVLTVLSFYRNSCPQESELLAESLEEEAALPDAEEEDGAEEEY